MGTIFDFKEAAAYDKWLSDPKKRAVLEMEGRLLLDVSKPLKGARLLDVGCGTGWFSQFFCGQGLCVTGIDPSEAMLDRARARVGHKVDLHQGFGEDLPFEDNSFDICTLITTLEFVDNPQKVLAEAARVAKDQIVIGCLNRWAYEAMKRRVECLLKPTVYQKARFYSVWELKSAVRSVLGSVPMNWRTAVHFPLSAGSRVLPIERAPWLQRSPFGAFVALSATCTPRFRTRPLTLEYAQTNPARCSAGLCKGDAANGSLSLR